MFGLAIHLSIVVIIALVLIFTEGFTMVMGTEHPRMFFDVAYKIMLFYLAWSGLIAIWLLWRMS